MVSWQELMELIQILLLNVVPEKKSQNKARKYSVIHDKE